MTTRKSTRGTLSQTAQRTKEQAGQVAQKAKTKGAQAVQNAGELKDGALTFKNFVKKVYNDWSLHLAQALAYSLITATVPIAILLIAIFGWFLGGLDHQAYTQLLSHIEKSLPQPIASPQIIDSAAQKLQNASGPLAIISVLSALFSDRVSSRYWKCASTWSITWTHALRVRRTWLRWLWSSSRSC
jgi:uncharacterized BrkB/YihY/UPF0761 family membrane protein